MFRKIHNALAWVTMIWLIISWLVIFLAYAKLGHLPVYGHDPDPTEMGFEGIKIISVCIAVLSCITVYLWPLILLSAFLIKGRQYKVDYLSLSVFVGSIILFFCFRSFLPAQFLWFND
jgi:hypothetical protein